MMPIYSLEDFSNTFLTKRNIVNIIAKYCVLTVDDELLVMRVLLFSSSTTFVRRRFLQVFPTSPL